MMGEKLHSPKDVPDGPRGSGPHWVTCEDLIEILRPLMAAIDNLTSNVTALASSVTSLTAAVDTAVTDLGAPAASDAAIQTQADAVAALTTAVNNQTARLNQATTPPPPPPPAPTG